MAILLLESEAMRFLRLIEVDRVRMMSAVTALELGMVVESRKGSDGSKELDQWLTRAGVKIIPFDEEQATLAREAFRRFGKGRHRAGLNFGDCAAYALAVWSGEPLLFKGDDFAHSDVEAVVAP